MGRIPVSINSIGFRDVEHEQTKPAGIYRVLFLGDSYTEALQVPFEDIFWRRLQKEADEKHLNVEIMSMSVSSWSTGQELRAYECFGRQYHPDVVVLGFNTDDLSDNAFRQDQFTPTFALKDGTLSLDESYKTHISQRLADRATLYPGILYFLKDHSELIRHILFIHANSVAGAKLGAAEEAPSSTENAWRLTGALISQLAHDTHADKSHLVIVNFPTLKAASIVPLQTFARVNNIALVDVAPALNAASSTAPVHWPGDPHLTPFGHEVVSQILIKAVLYGKQ